MGGIVLAETDDVLARPDDRCAALHAVGGIGQPRLGVLRQVMGGQLGGKASAELGRVSPGFGTGIDQSEHVRGQTQAVMQVRVAGQIEDRSAAVHPQPRRTRLDRVGTEPQPTTTP